MALALQHGRILSFPKRGGTNWVLVVRSCYRSRGQSKIPDLMRYIPEEARKPGGDKLEAVKFPSEQQRRRNIENEVYSTRFRQIEKSDDEEYSTPSRFRQIDKSDGEEYSTSSRFRQIEKSDGEKYTTSEEEVFSTSSKSDDEVYSTSSRIEYSDAEVYSASRQSSFQELTSDSGEKLQQAYAQEEYSTSSSTTSPASKIKPEGLVQQPKKSGFSASYKKTLRSTLNLFPASKLEPKTSDIPIQIQSVEDEDGINLEEQDEDLLSDDAMDMKIKELTTSDNPGERSTAKNYAIFLLGNGQKTAAELKKKLRDKKYSPRVIDQTIAELRELGFQSDATYAEIFTQSRWNARGWSSNRIKYELLRKGVDPGHIDRALKDVFKTDDSGKVVEEEEELKWDMSKSAQEHILALAARKWNRGGNISEDVKKRRLAGWLQRRGFSWKVITGIINSVQGKRPRAHQDDED